MQEDGNEEKSSGNEDPSVIFRDHKIIKTSFRNFDRKIASAVCVPTPWEDPPPPGGSTQIGWKTCKYGLKHAFRTLDGHFR